MMLDLTSIGVDFTQMDIVIILMVVLHAFPKSDPEKFFMTKNFDLILVTVSFWTSGLLSIVWKTNAKESLRTTYCMQSYALCKGTFLLFTV